MFQNSSKLEACRCTKCNNFQYEGVPGNTRLIWLTVWFSFKPALCLLVKQRRICPQNNTVKGTTSNLLFQFKLNLKSHNVITSTVLLVLYLEDFWLCTKAHSSNCVRKKTNLVSFNLTLLNFSDTCWNVQ